MKAHVLVTKRIFPEVIEYLEQHASVDYEPSDEGVAPAQLIERARGKQAILSQITDSFPPAVLAQLGGLGSVKVIGHVGVGYDNIHVAAASEQGILVTNTPGVLDDSTADFAFALLTAAARRVAEADRFVRAGQWKLWTIDLMIGVDIHHRTLGILGMGRIGQAMARRGSGFSMRVLYHNRTQLAPEIERELNAEFVSLPRLLRESDFLSIHTPLNDSTRHLIGEAQLRQMQPHAVLVNTSRGLVVDEAALARALKEHWIAAAGLDVFEKEPTVHPGLLECANAVLAPHVASSTVATRRRISMMAAENLVAALSGQKPPNLVNPAVWDSWASRPAAGG